MKRPLNFLILVACVGLLSYVAGAELSPVPLDKSDQAVMFQEQAPAVPGGRMVNPQGGAGRVQPAQMQQQMQPQFIVRVLDSNGAVAQNATVTVVYTGAGNQPIPGVNPITFTSDNMGLTNGYPIPAGTVSIRINVFYPGNPPQDASRFLPVGNLRLMRVVTVRTGTVTVS